MLGQVLKVVSFLFLFFWIFAPLTSAANPLNVVINEIAWMGTSVSYNDEWIELKNNTDQEINLDGWVLKAVDGTPEIKLTRSVLVNGFYLLERSKDYTGALENSGEILELYDNLGNLIDSVDASSGWPAGDNATKQTMEKTAFGWRTSQNSGGTPGAKNSETKATETRSPQVMSDAPLTSDVKAPTSEVAILPSPNGAGDTSFLVLAIAVFTSFLSGGIILILKHVRT